MGSASPQVSLVSDPGAIHEALSALDFSALKSERPRVCSQGIFVFALRILAADLHRPVAGLLLELFLPCVRCMRCQVPEAPPALRVSLLAADWRMHPLVDVFVARQEQGAARTAAENVGMRHQGTAIAARHGDASYLLVPVLACQFYCPISSSF